MAQVVIMFDGDFEALRAKLRGWGFEVGSRSNAPVFARGPGAALHAYRTGKILIAGARAQEWADRLTGAPVLDRRPAAPTDAEWVVHFDGSCMPRNPGGVAAYGFQVARAGRVVHEQHGLASPPGPGATNNVAEFRAVLEALRWLQAQGARAPLVRGDSELVVGAFNGAKRVHAPHLKVIFEEARVIARAIEARFEWVPREENTEADRLSREGFLAAVKEHPHWAR